MLVQFLFSLVVLLQSFALVKSLQQKCSYKTKTHLNVANSSPQAGAEPRRYASYAVYKGKGAMNVKIIAPTWANLPNSNSLIVSKEGGLLIEMAPSTANAKEYDWTKKITFLLDATECGQLVYGVESGAEFVHDPGALTPQAGKVTKRMKWNPAPDNKAVFVSLSISDAIKGDKSTVSIPVTWGEYMVIDSIMRYSIPKFLGMDHSVNNFGGGMSYELPPNPPPPQPWKQIE